MILFLASGRVSAMCSRFLINAVLKWSQYPTNVGNSPPIPTSYMVTITACQKQISPITSPHATRDWESVFDGTRRLEFIFLIYYLTQQQYPGSFKIPLLEYHTIAAKSLIGHYNPVALGLRKYENHFPKLIRASEKKRNYTLRCRVWYQNQIYRETRYQCEVCDGMPALCAAPCFLEYHNVPKEHQQML